MEEKNFSRGFLKCDFVEGSTDSKKGVPKPQIQKPYLPTEQSIDLVSPDEFKFDIKLQDAIKNRRSIRKFNDDFLTLKELSFLLWATQGITDKNHPTHRTVPAAHACHPFETYLLIRHVRDLKPGIYRYLPLEHKLCLPASKENSIDKISSSCFTMNQSQIQTAAIVFIWAAIPYRTEWRAGSYAAKLIALDAGHVCQNLYLASQAISAGTCAVTGYKQDEVDKIIGVDGKDEFTIYLATVGKIA